MIKELAFLVVLLGTPAASESTQRRIVLPPSDKVESMSSREAAAKCKETLADNQKLSAMDLLIGSGACAKATREVEASFLFNVATVRGAADVTLLIPANKEAAAAQHDLIITLYYGAASVGSDEVLRDPNDRKQLTSLIQSWKPQYSQAYQPGWQVGEHVTPEEYFAFIEEGRKDKLNEIRRVSVLVNDAEYYRLHTEYLALVDRVSKQEKQNPSDTAKIMALRDAKMRRAVALGDPTAMSASSMNESKTWQLGRPPLEEGNRDHPMPELPKAARIVQRLDDPIVKRCARSAKHNAVSGGGKVLKSVVVEESMFGVVYRADVSDDSGGTTRFWCSERFTGSTPLATGLGDDLEPLPAAPR